MTTNSLWVIELDVYETIEWNFALRVGVSSKFYFILYDMAAFETKQWKSPLRLALVMLIFKPVACPKAFILSRMAVMFCSGCKNLLHRQHKAKVGVWHAFSLKGLEFHLHFPCQNRQFSGSIAKMKRYGVSGSPCRSPRWCLILGPGHPLRRTEEEEVLSNTASQSIHLVGKPRCCSSPSRYTQETISKPFEVSSLIMHEGVLVLWKYLAKFLTYKKLSWIHLFLMKVLCEADIKESM
jgi:hypothetical protein